MDLKIGLTVELFIYNLKSEIIGEINLKIKNQDDINFLIKTINNSDYIIEPK